MTPAWAAETLLSVMHLRGGEKLPPLGVGSDCIAETDSLPEPHRVPGDKCGKDRLHWKAAK